jgi:hypothetical protein
MPCKAFLIGKVSKRHSLGSAQSVGKTSTEVPFSANQRTC